MTVKISNNFLLNARGITLLDGGGVTWAINKNTNEISATGSSGAVLSSVGLADGSTAPIYSVSGSPLTANGALTFTLATQTPKTFFAGPISGANAQPTFRVIAAADVPTLNQNTTGSAAIATAIAGGSANQIPYQTGAGATAFFGAQNYGVQIYSALGVPEAIAGTAGVLQGSASAIPTFTTTPVLGGANFSAIPNAALTNSSVTVNAGTGLTGGGAVALGASITLTNAGVTSAVSGTGVNVSGAVGAVTFSVNQGFTPTWTGTHTFTPSSGITPVYINGANGNYCTQITAGSASGNSFGVLLKAGTTSADIAVDIQNQAGTANLLLIYGDNHGQIGPISFTAAGATSHSGPIGVNGSAAPAQSTGWGTPTGGAVENNFAASGSASMATVSAALAQIIAVLKANGFLGT